MEIKKLKKLVLSLEHELERLQSSDGNRNREREGELEDKFEECERFVDANLVNTDFILISNESI